MEHDSAEPTSSTHQVPLERTGLELPGVAAASASAGSACALIRLVSHGDLGLGGDNRGGGRRSGVGGGGLSGASGARRVGTGRVQGGARDRVLGQGLVRVEQDASVCRSQWSATKRFASREKSKESESPHTGRGVQSSAQGAGGAVRAAASDGNVDAEGVVLRTALSACAVHGNDLVAEDIVARGKRRGDCDRPRVVVGDQVIGGPGLRGQVDAGLVNLHPLQGRLVDGRAVIATVGDVGQDRAEVG